MGVNEEAREGISYLRPGRRRDLDIAFIKECRRAIKQVNAVRCRDGQTPLIPEASRDADIVTHSKVGDRLTDGH